MKRNADGLIEGVEYARNADGSINWRAMIKPAHLYINREYESELKARFNKKSVWDIDVTQVEDKHLLILLAGIKDLARLRGYRSVRQKVDSVTNEKAVVTCEIEFIGNYETGGEPIVFSDVGSASLYSVSGTFQLHLEAIAANRAFVRCVRNALGVNIVGKDEFDARANSAYSEDLAKNGRSPILAVAKEGFTAEVSGFTVQHKLAEKCTSLGAEYTFEKIKERAMQLKEQFKSDPATWTGFDESIPQPDCFTLLDKLREVAEKKAKTKKG